MSLSDQEKVELFIERAKLSGFNPLVVGPEHVNEYANELANRFGQDRWDYYATVAAIGSVYTMMIEEFEENGESDLIELYENAIDEWDKDALHKVDNFMEFILDHEITSKRDYYTYIGIWLIEQMKDSEIENDKMDIATDLGKLIRTNMKIAMLH
jgi:hypothetical protein